MFSSNSSQVSSAVNYIENVFSTYLYTGTGSTQTITNNIDLSTYGGLTWIKTRVGAGYDHVLCDTIRGINYRIQSNETAAQYLDTTLFNSVDSNGFTLGTGSGSNLTNTNTRSYVSWTFREQAKFFDIVTYTGTGSNTTIAHALGSVPACIIVKRTDTTANWAVYHRSLANTQYLVLNTTAAAATGATWWNSTTPTSAVFSVGTDASVNASGGTYIAYIFAHDAGGFGLTGTDNVISCGTFTASTGETATVTLGYEPQWLLFKPSSTTGDWQIVDTMRPWPVASDAFSLKPNTSAAEANFGAIKPSATGFYATSNLTANATYIYIAIRRGPMAVPTLGTTVFEPVTSTSANAVYGSLQAFDMGLFKDRNTVANNFVTDRLRGFTSYYGPTLYTNLTNAEATPTTGDTVYSITSSASRPNGQAYFGGAGSGTDSPLGYSFKRAPGFFDAVCYTGTGSATTISHNLGAVPELIIVKARNRAEYWICYQAALGNAAYVLLNSDQGSSSGTYWNNTSPTSSVFSVSGNSIVGGPYNYVAYLFATCAGVSKVGTYTGTAATQTVDCGFGASGARFVLVKRTDTTGDWYVWDTARGMTSGTDPSLLLNTTAAEVNANSVYAISTGFQIVSTAAGINASAGAYIFFAIA